VGTTFLFWIMDNFVKLTGNLGSDAETRHFESGNQVTALSLAIYAGKDKPATWVKAKAWGEIDVDLLPRLTKGTRITVTGRLGPCEVWNGEPDNQAKGINSVIVDSIALTPWVDRNGSNGEARSQSTRNDSNPAPQDDSRPTEDYEDIPF
jgi:single stranded DNA-binding protein